MRVRAKTDGQLPDQSWVQPGDEFEIEDGLVSTKWMEPADGKPWPKAVLDAIANRRGVAVAQSADTSDLRAQIEDELRAKIRAELEAEARAKAEASAAIPATEKFERIDTDPGEDEGEQVPAAKPRGRPKTKAEDINDA